MKDHGDDRGAGTAELVRPRARRGGIPLYYRVMRDLKEQIVSGRLAPGDRLPSETEFTHRYSVSRVVVRRALQILQEQGLVIRLKGKGTYVAKGNAREATLRVSGSLEDLIQIGAGTTIKVVEFRMVKISQDVAEVFGDSEGDDIFHVKRVRFVGGSPLAVMKNYVPYSIASCISLNELTTTPLITLIEERGGCRIEWASQVFQAVAADDELADLLEVDTLTPLLKLTLTVYSTEGRVVDLAHVYYRSDRYYHHGFLDAQSQRRLTLLGRVGQ